MKRKLWAGILAVVMGLGSMPLRGAVTIDTAVRHQVIEGFGAAGGWYESMLTGHPQKVELYDLLFRQLGLDIYRVRNVYDQGWDHGSGYMSRSGQIIAAGEASLGRPLKVMISCWSPPAYLKSNDLTANGTLKKDAYGEYMYDELGDWWADSLTAWSSYGVEADYINVQNEPDYVTDSWDTCQYQGTETNSIAGYDMAFEAVWQELNARMGSSMPKMLGGEAAGIPNSYQYLNNLINPDHAYGYAHHLYNCNNGGGAGCGDEPDLYLTSMTNFASTFGSKPLFQTEYESSTDSWPDALNLAVLLHNSLTVEGVSAYLYWGLYWSGSGGLISLTSTSYTINSDYYGFKHFSAFIQSGWQRVEATGGSSDLRVSAYIRPDEQMVTVVLINTGSSAIQTNVSFSGISILDGNVYVTSQTQNCQLVGTYTPGSPVSLPGESIMTLQLSADGSLQTPDAPTGLTALQGAGTVELDWMSNSEADLTGYNVYRSTSHGGGYVKVNDAVVTDSEYEDTEVTNGITYYYAVTAVDEAANESDLSNEAFATPNDGSFLVLSSADFEYGFGQWVNIGGEDTHDWTRYSGSTPSSNTGPSGGAGGSTWYVYLETSAGGANSAGNTAILEGPEIEGSDRVLTFYYHMYGTDIGALAVDVYDGTWHEGIWSRSGQQQMSSTAPYAQAIVDLGVYHGTIRIRLRAVAAGWSLGDIAVDEIEVSGSLAGEVIYGDLSGDGTVDLEDLSGFMDFWLEEVCGEPDLNGDCLVNLNEFAVFAGNWLSQ